MNRLYIASRATVISLSLALVLASSPALAATQTTVAAKQAVKPAVHQSIFATLRQRLLASTLGFLLPSQTASAISGVLAEDTEDQSSYAESSYNEMDTYSQSSYDSDYSQYSYNLETGNSTGLYNPEQDGSAPNFVQADPWSEVGGGPTYPSLVNQDPWSEFGGGGGQTFEATPTGLSENQIDFSSPSAGGWLTDSTGGGLGDLNFGSGGSEGAFSSGIGSGLSDDQINFASLEPNSAFSSNEGGGVSPDGGLSGGSGLFSNGGDGGLNGEGGGFFSNVTESANNFIGSVEDAFGFGGGNDVAGGSNSTRIGGDGFEGAPAFEFGGGSSGDSSLSGPNANGYIGAFDGSGVAPIVVNQAALDDKDYAKDGMWEGFNGGPTPGLAGNVDETNGISRTTGTMYPTGVLTDEADQQRYEQGLVNNELNGVQRENTPPGPVTGADFERQRPGETDQQFADRTQGGNQVQNPNAPANPDPAAESSFYQRTVDFTKNIFGTPAEIRDNAENTEFVGGGMTAREAEITGNYNPSAPQIPSTGAKLDGTDITLLGPDGENILVRPESILPGGENYALVHPEDTSNSRSIAGTAPRGADEGQQLGETDEEYVARTGGQNGTQATSQTPPNPNDPFASLRTQSDADLNGYNGTGGNTKTGTNGSAIPETQTDDKADVIAARKESDTLQANKSTTATDNRTTADADLNGYNGNGQTTPPPAIKTTTTQQPPSQDPKAYQNYLFDQDPKRAVPSQYKGEDVVNQSYVDQVLRPQYEKIQQQAGPGAKLPDFESLTPAQVEGFKNRLEQVNGNTAALAGLPVTTTQVASNAGSTGLISGSTPGQQIGGMNWMLQGGPTAAASAAPFDPDAEIKEQDKALEKYIPRASINEQLVQNEQQTQSEIAGRDNPNTTYRSVQDQLLDFNKQVEAGKATPAGTSQPTSLEDQLRRNDQEIQSQIAGSDSPNKPNVDPMTITNTLNATPPLDDNNSVKYLDRTPALPGQDDVKYLDRTPPLPGQGDQVKTSTVVAPGPAPSALSTALDYTVSGLSFVASPALAASRAAYNYFFK